MLLFLGSLLLGAVRLEGRVLDAQGAPAGSAEVCLASQGDFLDSHTRLESRASCDASGAFSIEVPRGWIERTDYRPLALFAWKSGNGIGAVVWGMQDVPVGQPVSVQLSPAAQAVLEVLDADGKPVVGARVEPWSFQLGSESHGAPAEFCAHLGALTDAQGRATIDACPLERILELHVLEPGGGTQILTDSMSHPPEWAAGRIQLRARPKERLRATP